MTPFDRCLSVVLGHEGQDTITDDPRDPGGLTRWGISAASHPGVDIRNLTREGAADIYRRDYWLPNCCDDLPPPVALCVFDSGVNQGTYAAARMLQAVLGVEVDGKVGAKTILAAHKYSATLLIRRFQTARAHKYIGTGGFVAYGRGWIGRTIDVTAEAIQWAVEGAK